MTTLLSLPIGTKLVDDYRIERVLGAGGFGITYLAREAEVDRYVTIKEYFPNDFAYRGDNFAAVPRSRSADNDYEWGLDRFIEEARTLGKFDHRNIVRLYRYFRANNTGYMVLHFEEGQSLKAWLRGLGRAPRQTELDELISPLLDALTVIHAADFLHRDIAPDNIIVRRDGSPVLIDFGSARGDIAHHTRTISALVKPGYSPYEQYSETASKQGAWTDIYAFAGTLYHAVTGKRPPDSPSRVIKDDLQPARDAAIGAYRAGFLAAIDRGLSLGIDGRPQSVAEWSAELLALENADRGWFRGGKSAPAMVDRHVANHAVTPTRKLANSASAGLPIDRKRQDGSFVDFIDRLKRKNRARDRQSQPEIAQQEAIQATSDTDTLEVTQSSGETRTAHSQEVSALVPEAKARRSFRLGWGPNRNRRPNATLAASRPSVALDGEVIAAAPPPRSALPVPVRERAPPRALKLPRPRPLPGFSAARWRPIVFKLLVGIGVATGAVALQDRLPWLEAPVSEKKASGSSKTGTLQQTAAVQLGERATPRPQSALLHTFRAHQSPVTNARFAKSGKLIVTTGADGTLKVWDAASRILQRVIDLSEGPATALATREELALTGHSEGAVVLWDLDTGLQSEKFKRNEAAIWEIVFAGSSERFWAAGHDWSTALWSLAQPGQPLKTLKGHDNAVQALAYVPTREFLATGGADRAVQLWEARGERRIRRYRKARDFITALAFSENGRTLAAGTLDGRLRIMRTNSHRIRARAGHIGAIADLDFLSENRLVSAGKDGTLRLWNIKQLRTLRTFRSSGTPLVEVDKTPDGDRLLSADIDGYVRLWDGRAF
ncbi:MAG: protein kinase domain-containing protein [Hyphomicrobiaceae bacterium]